MASVKGVSVRYGMRTIFSGVSLTLQPGSFTAIVGPNGSGKSSLLRVLARVQRPNTWSVADALGVALVASSVNPPSDVTPRELADYGLALRRPWWRLRPTANDETAVAAALERTGLDDRADDPVAQLSAGEVQRAWIAAALATSARTLLIDEPTTHLDLRYQVEILETLKTLTSSGVAIAAAIHDLTLAARFADTIALLAGGTIVSGPPVEVLEPEALRRAFGVAVTIHRHPDEGYLVCLPR
ncbi:MAG TPA: ABC transporter ATP-binding protein [Candidatus Eremiobacteraceae bacterium]|nr:ABC transporter ATP-binding protein [Candidatus Eremiobacteraceae bacterium]